MPNSHPSPHHQLAPMSLHVLVLFFQIAYEIHGVNLAPSCTIWFLRFHIESTVNLRIVWLNY